MKADTCDYGEGVTLGRRKSGKAAPAAAVGDEGDDTGADAAAGATPALANGRLDNMQGSAGPATTTGKLPSPLLNRLCVLSRACGVSFCVQTVHHIPQLRTGARPVTYARPPATCCE